MLGFRSDIPLLLNCADALVLPSDSAALAKAITRILTMPRSEYDGFKTRARKSAERFSVDSMAVHTLEIYRLAMAHQRGGN